MESRCRFFEGRFATTQFVEWNVRPVLLELPEGPAVHRFLDGGLSGARRRGIAFAIVSDGAVGVDLRAELLAFVLGVDIKRAVNERSQRRLAAFAGRPLGLRFP